jgi:ubiquinone/menaquinone biosynthesis C-methylase UbiE
MAMAHHHHHDFVPAAGRRWLLPLYDPLIALLTNEKHWRGQILQALDLRADDVLVDVGCGTGTLAIMAKQRAPQATVIGVDPDHEALARTRSKASRKGVALVLHQGFGNEVATLIGRSKATKVVSSFAFHHMPVDMQVETLASMRDALASGGTLVIADFVGGHFGGADDGTLEARIKAAGFENVRVLNRFRVAFSDVVVVAGKAPVMVNAAKPCCG